MTKNVVCNCGEIIVKSQGAGFKIRSKILIVENGSITAVCKSCGHDNRLSMTLSTPKEPKLIVTRKKIVDMK